MHNANVVNSSRGRPRGGSDARQRLIDAARVRFEADGYASTSVRSVAREAGVDHSLVNYYFGSKHGLFAEVLAITYSPQAVFDEIFAPGASLDPMRMAERLLVGLLTVWEEPGSRGQMLEVVRQAAMNDALRATTAEFVGAEIVRRISGEIKGPDAQRRAAGAGAVVSGLVFGRFVLGVEPLASMSTRDVVRTLAPMIAMQLDPAGVARFMR